MKKHLYKMFVTLAIALVTIGCALFCGGCYAVKPGSIQEIVGTYELTKYSAQVNELEEQEIQCYIVVTASGNGWFAYKDKDTALVYAEMRFRFITDTEETDKYTYVEADFGTETDNSEKWHKFGVNVSAKNLNSREAKMKGNIFDGNYGVDYYIDVTFTKKSDKTDLSYVEKKLGKAQTVLPYGALLLNGVYHYAWRDGVEENVLANVGYEEPTVYAFFTFDFNASKAKALYMLKSDEVQREEEYTLTITSSTNGENFDVQIGRKTYSIEIVYTSVRMAIPEEVVIETGEVKELQWHFSKIGELDSYDLARDIQNAVERYQEIKNQQ